MADLSRDELQRLARLGAQARIEELKREEDSIRRAFPDLFGGRRGRRGHRAAGAQASDGATATGQRKRKRSRMSAAARRAVSARMKKYWAERRKSKASK